MCQQRNKHTCTRVSGSADDECGRPSPRALALVCRIGPASPLRRPLRCKGPPPHITMQCTCKLHGHVQRVLKYLGVCRASVGRGCVCGSVAAGGGRLRLRLWAG